MERSMELRLPGTEERQEVKLFFFFMYIIYISMIKRGAVGQEEIKTTDDAQRQPNSHDTKRQVSYYS